MTRVPSFVNIHTPEPEFTVSEMDMPDLNLTNAKIGDKVDAFIGYQVIEKTRNFTIIKVISIQLLPKNRL